jgi:PST family polysaccharide transporter
MSTAAVTIQRDRDRVSWSSITLLAENLVRLGVTAAISFWLARTLGPAQFGVLNFATALLAIFGIAAAMGLEVPAVLRLAQSNTPMQSATLGSLLGLRLAASTACAIVAAALALSLRAGQAEAQAVSVIVVLSLVAQVPSVFDYWFKSCVQAGPPAAARVVTTMLSASAKFWVVHEGLGLVALAWTVVFEALVGSALLWWVWRRHSRATLARGLRFDRRIARELLNQSLPFLATNVAVMLYMKADVVLLGFLSTNEQTGLYTLVQKISEVIYVVPVVLIDSAYPLLARRLRSTHDDLPTSGQLLFDLAVGSAIVCAVVAACAAAPLVHAVFGERYAASAPLIAIHAWTCVALALDVARHRWLAARGLQRYAFRLAALGAAVGLALNAVLIPRFGALGATVSAVVAFVATSLAGTLLFPALRDLARMQWRALWPYGRLWNHWRDQRRAASAS